LLTTWFVVPTCLPTVVRDCVSCPSGRFVASGKFRVNAHHKSLDAWLLVLCTTCGTTAKLTVLERTPVRAVPPRLLDQLHANDPALVAQLLQSTELHRRNRVRLDWAGAWRLDAASPPAVDSLADGDALHVEVRFEARIPVRPARLVAAGSGLTRGQVERRIADGSLVSTTRLTGTVSSDFAFLLKW
jgi:hypothetical protein